MAKKYAFRVGLLVVAAALVYPESTTTTATSAASWNPATAAAYLDGRAKWWVGWAAAQRDHGTTCVSCHTILPYVLSRNSLSPMLHEPGTPQVEQTVLANVRKRVALWSEVQPYYLDASAGPGKSKESRSTEAVLNALVLASQDRQSGKLTDQTRTAFASAWALQIRSGASAGAWDWQVFHLSPWEGTESQYAGALWMALAAGWAPDHYARETGNRDYLRNLRAYLRREYRKQPLWNRAEVLWASQNLSGLLSGREKTALVAELCARQSQDGGWRLADLGKWTRTDNTPQASGSDGLATALITLALDNHRSGAAQAAHESGVAWLRTHQDAGEGFWRTESLNKKRDPKSDVGRFMSDAATGYAVLALRGSR